MIRSMVNEDDDMTFSQGSIFNCAISTRYPNSETLGLVITARCDIANNDKVQFFNFIPAIPFDLWKENELIALLHKRKINDLKNQIERKIVKFGFSQENIKTYGRGRVLGKISEGKIKKDEFEKLTDLYKKLDYLETPTPFNTLVKNFKSDIHSLIKELTENKISDYFFIDHIKGYGSIVVNLREIHELDICAANDIPNGITIKAKIPPMGLKKVGDESFCSIVGQLKSPYIELLIQRFSYNFMKIGVDNPYTELTSKLVEGEK